MIKKTIHIAIYLVIATCSLMAQAPSGEFRMLHVLDNFDTVSVNRRLSPWWFGVTGGATLGVSFGDLRFPDIIPEDGDDIPYKLIDYNTGYGSGTYLGLYGEWLPIDEMWGVALRINFLDKRKTQSESDQMPDTFQTKYVNTYSLNYITISPSARYNLPVENLYLFAGADLEFNISKEIIGKKEFANSAEISHDKILPVAPNSFRAAFHFGVGYDIFAADMYNAVRAYISPYASVHIGSSELSAYTSSRLPLLVKLGANVKFNIDEKQYDTIPVNKDYVEPPSVIASYRRERGVSFAGFAREQMISASLKEIPVTEKIDVVVKQEPQVVVTEKVKVDTKEEPQKKNISINPNATKIIYFPSSESSALTKVNKEYLDALADYLKKNPNVTVRITGHSDNAGSTVQNQARSENRATAIVQYLMKKDISRRRLLDRGRGALDPIADNASDAGRSKNRRVEIQLVR